MILTHDFHRGRTPSHAGQWGFRQVLCGIGRKSNLRGVWLNHLTTVLQYGLV